MRSCNHIEHYRKKNCIVSHTRKTRLHFSSIYFHVEHVGYWSQRRAVVFLQRKPLPRSTTNSTVGICTRVRKDTALQQPALTLYKTRVKGSIYFDNILTMFPFCIQKRCPKKNAKEWAIPREGVLHFRAPKFGLKNTSVAKRCLVTMLHKFRSGWVTIISFLLS